MSAISAGESPLIPWLINTRKFENLYFETFNWGSKKNFSNPATRRYFSSHSVIPLQWTFPSRSRLVKPKLLKFTALFKLMDKLQLCNIGNVLFLSWKKSKTCLSILSRLKRTSPTGGLTEKLSNSLAYRTTIKIISPLQQTSRTSEGKELPKEVIFVSMHITSLYLNIPQVEGINKVCTAHENF